MKPLIDSSVVFPALSGIKTPMTLREITEAYKDSTYNAETLLQHLLLWVETALSGIHKVDDEPKPTYERPSAYSVMFRGVKLDPYRVADLFNLPAALAAALKKILRRGRGDKSEEQDLREAMDSIQRHIEMMKEDKQ